jgi:gamma-glutamyltranspeptidase / glutathione hydrolase
VAVLLHSCNCLLWGANGISVDGITIPDPASLYPDQIARAGPGARLPEATNPVMVLEGGRPSLAASTIGVGLQQVALQNLIYILDFGMDAQKAVDQPNFQGGLVRIGPSGVDAMDPGTEAMDSTFPIEVIDGVRSRGQAVSTRGTAPQAGYWIAIQIDPKTHQLTRGLTRRLNSFAEGY